MEKKLQFEEGKIYRTRDGQKVFIKSVYPEELVGQFVVFGSILGVPNGDNAGWKACGGYMPQTEHELDLVAEWEDEAAADGPVLAAERKLVTLATGAQLICGLNDLAVVAHHMAIDKGFYNDEVSPAQQIALIHSEASELLETYRKPAEQSAKIPGFSTSEEEAADIIIRMLDMAGHRDMRIGQAVMAKMAYNSTRPTKHGKEF